MERDELDPKIANKLGISSHPDDIKERQRIMTSLENENHQTLSSDARALLSMLENITELFQLKILLQLD